LAPAAAWEGGGGGGGAAADRLLAGALGVAGLLLVTAVSASGLATAVGVVLAGTLVATDREVRVAGFLVGAATARLLSTEAAKAGFFLDFAFILHPFGREGCVQV